MFVLLLLLVYLVAVLLCIEKSDSDVASFFPRQESIHTHLHLVKVLIDTEGMTIGVNLLLLVLTITDGGAIEKTGSLPPFSAEKEF